MIIKVNGALILWRQFFQEAGVIINDANYLGIELFQDFCFPDIAIFNVMIFGSSDDGLVGKAMFFEPVARAVERTGCSGCKVGYDGYDEADFFNHVIGVGYE